MKDCFVSYEKPEWGIFRKLKVWIIRSLFHGASNRECKQCTQVFEDPFHHFHSMFQQFNSSVRSTLHWIPFPFVNW